MHNITYTYDNLNRLSTVKENGTVEATYTYDTNGNRASLTLANGVVTTYSYNLANWVTALTNKKSNNTVLSGYTYTYYASGNQKSKTDNTGKVTSYVYDDIGRLTQESETNGVTLSYTYDAAGNRTKLTATGSENYVTNYTYNNANQLTSEVKTVGSTAQTTSYTYDNNGNMLSKTSPDGTQANTYNKLNQLVSSINAGVTSSYTYNADGIRTSKTVGTTTTNYLLDGGNVVGEVQNGTVTATYLRGANLLSTTSGTSTSYYLFNAHGDVTGLANSAQTVTKTYEYDAFGNEDNPSATDTNPFRYCGEYYDTETGTYYLRARYYDPAIGRFTSQDSVRYTERSLPTGNITDPLSLNYYTYSANNPIYYCDPSGNAWETVLDVAGLCWSATDFYNDPSWENAGNLAWDIAAIALPVVPGSYTAKLAKGFKLFNRFDNAADTARAVNISGDIIRGAKVASLNGQAIVAPYRELKKIVAGQGLEVHHLIEKRFAHTLGIDPKNVNDILSIAIDKDFHRKITSEIRNAIGYSNEINKEWTTLNADPNKIWSTFVSAYEKNGMAEYLPSLKEQLLNIAGNANKITDWCGY